MPHANGRVERARDLVLGGLGVPQANYSFQVRSASSKSKTYVVTPEGCECPDSAKVEGGRCQHLIATWIWRKARAAVEAQGSLEASAGTSAAVHHTAPEVDDTLDTATDTPEVVPPAPAPAPTIPAWALEEVHGKQFMTFGGLLAMAHERGLVSLKAEFITGTAELALAHAVATFTDGRTFDESSDATPANVNAKIRPHFPRMVRRESGMLACVNGMFLR
jgi:hypothetical protein